MRDVLRDRRGELYKMMNPNDNISEHFTWHEALWLPKWNRHATEDDGLNGDVLKNLTQMFLKMDKVRDLFGQMVIVQCAYRPEKYNAEVGGAANSAHMALEPGVAAVDFHIVKFECDKVRSAILSHGVLDFWGLRMEDLDGPWVHLDNRQPLPGHTRFFKP